MIDPNIALQVRPAQIQDPMDSFGRLMTLRNMAQQQRAGALQQQSAELELEQQKREMQDQETLRQAYSESGGDLEKLQKAVAGKVSPKTMLTLNQAVLTQREKLAGIAEKELPVMKSRLEALSGAGQSLLLQAPEQRPASWSQLRTGLIQAGQAKAEDLPEQYPGDDWVNSRVAMVGGATAALDREYKRRQEERAAAEHKAKLPGMQAQSEQQQLQLAGQTAAPIANQADWDAWRATLPADVQKRVPPMYSGAARELVQRMGMTPEQQSSADFRRQELSGQAAGRAETARHNRAVESRLGAAGANAGLIQAVMQNPALYDDLTPSVKTAIAPELANQGFSGFGKRLSESAITKMSDSRSAISSLQDLREVLKKNEKYIGPVTGLWAMNPWSDARKAQADIDRVRQRVGKALEGGVLRKEDEEKYKKILAEIQDKPGTAIYKVDRIIHDIERDLDTFIEEQRRAGRKVDTEARTAPAAAGPSRVSVTAPNGKVYVFQSQEAAAEFKKKARIP